MKSLSPNTKIDFRKLLTTVHGLPNSTNRFFSGAIMAMLYTHSVGNPPLNKMVVFKMRDSVPSARYSPICNVLRQWKTSLIPIYSLPTL